MPRHPASGPGPDLSLWPTHVQRGTQMKETGVPLLRINSAPPPTHTHTNMHIETLGGTHNSTRPFPRLGCHLESGRRAGRAHRGIRGPSPRQWGNGGPDRERSACSLLARGPPGQISCVQIPARGPCQAAQAAPRGPECKGTGDTHWSDTRVSRGLGPDEGPLHTAGQPQPPTARAPAGSSLPPAAVPRTQGPQSPKPRSEALLQSP